MVVLIVVQICTFRFKFTSRGGEARALLLRWWTATIISAITISVISVITTIMSSITAAVATGISISVVLVAQFAIRFGEFGESGIGGLRSAVVASVAAALSWFILTAEGLCVV